MSSPYNTGSTVQPERKQSTQDELTEWRDSTNVILDYYQDFLQCGSATDRVQLSSLKDMNNALLASTHRSYDERVAEAKKYNYQAQYLGNKLQILFHRQNGTEHSAYEARYAVLHGQGYNGRTKAAETAALSDRYLITIDPKTFAITRRSPTW